MKNEFNTGYLSKSETNVLMNSVYEWMMVGLLISGLSAFMVTHSSFLLHLLFGNPYAIWVLFFIEIGLVIAISSGINKMDISTARVLFILFSIVDGMTLASIFLIYTETSIATTFFMAAMTFGVMSLYGYFTDNDLSSWGGILFAGLIGIIIALVVNFFLQSPAFEWWISVIGVIIFVGLTAYDTQKIKQMGEMMANDDAQSLSRVAIVGALALYLDFINLFIMMLEFFGNRRN
ncbi:FIG005935: membrane protein [hydrothermal vent metagenome]|uniref:FIG005935: membrane protein n=1 Tax=hydrothermal vent metagenome TaxID=652676 RepID=A0A1W1D2H1_9ZZZZ